MQEYKGIGEWLTLEIAEEVHKKGIELAVNDGSEITINNINESEEM
jgi:hypothetical protein